MIFGKRCFESFDVGTDDSGGVGVLLLVFKHQKHKKTAEIFNIIFDREEIYGFSGSKSVKKNKMSVRNEIKTTTKVDLRDENVVEKPVTLA